MSGKIDVKAVTLAGAVTWAFAVLLLGVGSMFLSSWTGLVEWLGNLYIGYAPTLLGSLIGAVWAFLDMGIGLYMFCWLYNYFHNK